MTSGPAINIFLSLALILAVAKVGGHVAVRLRQPSVLGELLAGVLLGNLALFGIAGVEPLKSDAAIDVLAQLGVIVLLFQVGLESSVSEMLSVGVSSVLVATLGVAGPFALGWGVGAWLLPDSGLYTHLFLGAALTATSVGITARVLEDLGRSGSDEARVILGAAVIDDVEGLIILAIVVGVVTAADHGNALSYSAIASVLLKAVAFIAGALLFGRFVASRFFLLVSKLETEGTAPVAALTFCFLASWTAGQFGLSPIVGAFTAGLVIEPRHYRNFVDRGEPSLDATIEPVASFLVPIFFVLMGLRTDLHAFANPGVVGLTVALTIAAIFGKQICALGVVERRLDRMSIGLGMIPRGEVGLIFANVGLALTVAGKPVVDATVFAAIVAMIMITTVITPPALRWSFSRTRTA